MNTKTLAAMSAGTVLAAAMAMGWHPQAAAQPTPELVADGPGVAAGSALRARGARAARLLQALQDPALAAIVNLRAIERVYRVEGREAEIPKLYGDVLARTSNPAVRNFVALRLARIEMRDKDAKSALDALMRSLDENLQRL